MRTSPVVGSVFAVFALLLFPGCTPSDAIQNRGSDTLLEVAQAWSANYEKASVEVSGGGSGLGISQLIDQKVDIANASREMKPDEIEAAKKKTGKDPNKLTVGYDAIALYVHKDNPLEEITVEQIKQIYGDGGTITKWSQLGVEVPGCGSDEIVVMSRQNNSGTYEYLREAVLGKNAKYRQGTIDASGSREIVTQVGQTPCAIGYSGMGYKTDDVKFLKVKKDDTPAKEPSVESVLDGTYVLSRPLFMYTLGAPEGEVKEYLDWIRSDTGQKILADIGYVPLPANERTNAAAE
jgi:phosphate transport system substrate-binding protein